MGDCPARGRSGDGSLPVVVASHRPGSCCGGDSRRQGFMVAVGCWVVGCWRSQVVVGGVGGCRSSGLAAGVWPPPVTSPVDDERWLGAARGCFTTSGCAVFSDFNYFIHYICLG
ncbi:hypothetical protein Dimus_038951 [Dionaea muscipula]